VSACINIIVSCNEPRSNSTEYQRSVRSLVWRLLAGMEAIQGLDSCDTIQEGVRATASPYSQTPCFCNPLFMQIATKRKPLRSLS